MSSDGLTRATSTRGTGLPKSQERRFRTEQEPKRELGKNRIKIKKTKKRGGGKIYI